MKQVKTNRPLLPVLLLAALWWTLAGCTATDVEERHTSQGNLREVDTHFYLNILSTATPRTRSLTFTEKGATETDSLPAPATKAAAPLEAAQEQKLQSMWIGQYDSEGTRVASEYISELTSQTEVSVQLRQPEGNSRIYLVANAGDLTASTQGKTETDFKALSRTGVFNTDGLPADGYCIMTGLWEGKVTGNIEGTVSLIRAMAKICFTYSISTKDFKFTPQSLCLKSVPKQLQYTVDSLQCKDFTYDSYIATPSAEGGTCYWYLPENHAGIVTGDNAVATDKEKAGLGVQNATYIELVGEATQRDVTYQNVTLKLYPGNTDQDNYCNNYNVSRNSFYNIGITLTGIDFADKRITIGKTPVMKNPDGMTAGKGSKDTLDVTLQPGKPWEFIVPEWLNVVINARKDTARASERVSFNGPARVEFIAVKANPTAAPRTAVFRIDTTDITLTQAGSELHVTPASPSVLTLAASADSTAKGTFTATAGLPWSAILASEWGGWLVWENKEVVTSADEATGEAQPLPIKALYSNPSAADRTGTITVKAGDLTSGHTKEISVTQKGSTVTCATDTVSVLVVDTITSFSAPKGLNWLATLSEEAEGWLAFTDTPSGTTTGEKQDIGIKTCSINPDSLMRTGTIQVRAGNNANDPHPGPTGNITIRQNASLFTVSPDTLRLACLADTSEVLVTGTKGLLWTVSPEKSKGITAQTTSSTATGSEQTLTFTAEKNVGAARTDTFTLAVTGGNHSKKVIVIQAAGTTGPYTTIDKEVLTAYTDKLQDLALTLTQFPPFNYDGGQMKAGVLGTDKNKAFVEGGGSYNIEIQSGQHNEYLEYMAAITYCETLVENEKSDWRIPTIIELYAMYENKVAIEAVANVKPFIADSYWSSSLFNGEWNNRCKYFFTNGAFNGNPVRHPNPIRCVRDL